MERRENNPDKTGPDFKGFADLREYKAHLFVEAFAHIARCGFPGLVITTALLMMGWVGVHAASAENPYGLAGALASLIVIGLFALGALFVAPKRDDAETSTKDCDAPIES